jgi:hypothetical protein
MEERCPHGDRLRATSLFGWLEREKGVRYPDGATFDDETASVLA